MKAEPARQGEQEAQGGDTRHDADKDPGGPIRGIIVLLSQDGPSSV